MSQAMSTSGIRAQVEAMWNTEFAKIVQAKADQLSAGIHWGRARYLRLSGATPYQAAMSYECSGFGEAAQ